MSYSLAEMQHERTESADFDRILHEPFSRMEAMVETGPVERCERMLRRLDQLDSELTRLIDAGIVLAKSKKLKRNT
ncbi:MAG: hypothetical protein ACOCZ9_03510 [Spirochaetota bacterium]